MLSVPIDKGFQEYFDSLLTWLSKDMEAAFLAGLASLASGVTPEKVMQAYTISGVAGLDALFSREVITAYFNEYLATVTNSYLEGGAFFAAKVRPFKGAQGITIKVQFNALNPKTAAVMEAKRLDLITNISNDTRTVIGDLLGRGVRLGEGPIETARQIRQHIGLNKPQLQWVQNYRAELENLSSKSLGRELRDRRFDSLISRAVEDGKKLPKAKIDQMVKRYAERLVKSRAETIAKTETMEIVSAANHLNWQQMVDDNLIQGQQIRRHWRSSHDSKTRHAHLVMARMNPDGVGQDEAFKSELGAIRYPGDPQASAANRVNCRCYIVVKLLDPI